MRGRATDTASLLSIRIELQKKILAMLTSLILTAVELTVSHFHFHAKGPATCLGHALPHRFRYLVPLAARLCPRIKGSNFTHEPARAICNEAVWDVCARTQARDACRMVVILPKQSQRD